MQTILRREIATQRQRVEQLLLHGGFAEDNYRQHTGLARFCSNADFAYEDANKRVRRVPRGTVVNDASIPSALWSVIGGPFSGKYRDASVVHDRACVDKKSDWKNAHRVFYEAMLTSGVARWTASQVYLAVYFFGPKWGGKGPVSFGRVLDRDHLGEVLAGGDS